MQINDDEEWLSAKQAAELATQFAGVRVTEGAFRKAARRSDDPALLRAARLDGRAVWPASAVRDLAVNRLRPMGDDERREATAAGALLGIIPIADAAELAGISLTALRTAVSEKTIFNPAPDPLTAAELTALGVSPRIQAQIPHWFERSAVLRWKKSRPGRGNWASKISRGNQLTPGTNQ